MSSRKHPYRLNHATGLELYPKPSWVWKVGRCARGMCTLFPAVLSRLVNEADITLLPFPDEVLRAAAESAFALFDEIAAADAEFASIYKEWSAFWEAIQAWHGLAESGYLQYVGRSR